MADIEKLRAKANSLPTCPGVYIMKDSRGDVIYVGKSKKLKNRVTSYFVGTGHTFKTARMVSLVKDFDYIVCETEIESLALENTLIKKYSPKYNIKLKDAKSYPYIKVTNERYPRLTVTRERSADRAKYFGPYQSTAAAYNALDTVKRIFTLPTCKRSFPQDIGKERPCIYKDMGRCIAPCTGNVTEEEFGALVRSAQWILDGNIKGTKEQLREMMETAAEELEFERAASFRDSIAALDKLSERQKVVADLKVNRDVFAIYTTPTEGALAMLSVRGGALVAKNEFILSGADMPDVSDAISLIVGYYDMAGAPPKEIMLDFPIEEEERELLSEYLSLETKYKVAVKIPERGEGRALCDMALENAKESARQTRLDAEREDKSVRLLCTLIGLDEMPTRIEVFDISNIGKEHITASMVVWERGKLKKSDYRIFTVRSTDGVDDYASMKEAITRRLSHIGDGTASLGEMPQLLLIDGGSGHVNTVKEVLRTSGIEIPTFGMVKDDFHKTRALTDGENDISIAKEQSVYTFIYNLQEEAHRFAVKNSQKAKIKTMTRSSLENIKGIGEKKARLLLAAMPLGKIRTATKEELCAVSGIGEKDAENIVEYYKQKNGKAKERIKG